MIPLTSLPANDVRPKRLARRSPTAGNQGQGGNWIRKKRRHAIYARDEHTCVWCQRAALLGGVDCVHSGATLDHFLAREHGGTNETANLLTCCFACNSKRGSLPALSFATSLAAGCADRRFEILERVLAALDRPAPKPQWRAPPSARRAPAGI